MADCSVYINGVLNSDANLHVQYVRASYVRPWEAALYYAGCHDAQTHIDVWDEVRIVEGGSTRFRGNVTEVESGGVANEGVTYIAKGKRFRLENEPVRINGRGYYIWNRRGHLCDEGQGGEDSPGGDGGKWTAGEIIIDILEHALGLPALGSDIPVHHGDDCSVVDTYLDFLDVAGYMAADWLALDSIVGEFVVDNTPIAQAISLLVALNGGFYGWYIHPSAGALVLRDLTALATADIEAGEHGAWQDAGGTDYRLLGNQVEWSLEGVCSTIIIQGTDRLQEEQPANIEGTANPGAGNLGELELIAAPWKDFPAAYHALCQETRHFCAETIDDASALTPPAGYWSFSHRPRIYVGTDAGAKVLYWPTSGIFPTWMVPCGIIGFHEVPAPGPSEKLWGWYWAQIPFTAAAGPDGDAYHCYGYERTRTVYDPGFKHTTSWPQPGTADDETAMGILAARLLQIYKDVRRQGRLSVDEVDFSAYSLDRRYNVVNLGPLVCGGTTSVEPAECTAEPTEWETLAINAVDVLWDLERDVTELTVANTFFMLEEYSELKRRLEMNLFAQRELDLSESIFECQITDGDFQDDGSENLPTTTTTLDGTTTTAEPGTTTTAEGGGSTTTAEGGGTTTTAEPGGTTTTQEAATTTTEEPGPTTTAEPGPTTTAEPGPGPTTTVEPGTTTTQEAGTTTTGEPGTTTTGEPGTTTTGEPGTTTTGEPGSTTTGEPTTTSTSCPDSCGPCAVWYSCDVPYFTCEDDPPGGCTVLWPTGGLIVWDQDEFNLCHWWFFGSSDIAISVVLNCFDGQWGFVVHNGICGYVVCEYRRPALDDCPDGTYSLTASSGCPAGDGCPGELTVFVGAQGPGTTTTGE